MAGHAGVQADTAGDGWGSDGVHVHEDRAWPDPGGRYREFALTEPPVRGLRVQTLRQRPFPEAHAPGSHTMLTKLPEGSLWKSYSSAAHNPSPSPPGPHRPVVRSTPAARAPAASHSSATRPCPGCPLVQLRRDQHQAAKW